MLIQEIPGESLSMPESLLLDTLHPVRSWVPHPLGPDETRMVANTASLPCVFKHLVLMPDAHLGKGDLQLRRLPQCLLNGCGKSESVAWIGGV